jgi:hypothetical protein
MSDSLTDFDLRALKKVRAALPQLAFAPTSASDRLRSDNPEAKIGGSFYRKRSPGIALAWKEGPIQNGCPPRNCPLISRLKINGDKRA